MHDGMPYGRNQGHSREVDRQSPTGLIFVFHLYLWVFVNFSSKNELGIFVHCLIFVMKCHSLQCTL